MKKILIILGSTRQGRKGELVANWVKEYVKASNHKGISFSFSDLRNEALPFIDSPIPPMSGQYPVGKVTKWAKKIDFFDGYLIITPEYNHGYPGVLKNALDVIYKEWNYKPVSFVSYGGTSGGIRAVEQLRQVVIDLKMIPLREEVSIPFIWQAFDEKENLINPEHTEHALQSVLDAFSLFYSSHKGN